MKNILKIIIALLLFNFCTIKLLSQPGTLDQTFGDHGIVFNDSFSPANACLILKDGRILVAGRSKIGELLLWRFMPDGNLDISFGLDGRSIYNVGDRLRQTYDMILQPDDKILIVGENHPAFSHIDAGIIRFMQDGILDSSFGANGFDSIHINNYNYPGQIVLQEDGKIVIDGVTSNAQGQGNLKASFLARIMPNGGLDPTFGEEGIVTKNYSEAIEIHSLVIRPGGKLVTGGSFDVFGKTSYMLSSFNQDGSVDATFGENGTAKFLFGQGQGGLWNNDFRAMALQADGKIVCTGITGKGEVISMGLCRFNEDGTVDEGFGESGGVITTYIGEPETRNIAIQPDGKILTVGDEQGFGNIVGKVLLARYTPGGLLDSTFAENGIAGIYVDTIDEQTGRFINLVAENKILIAGTAGPIITNIYFARFNGDNVLASNFKEVKAIQENEAITITWQTLNESNTKSYTVERSNNAKDYAGINTIPAKHAATNSYSYTDKNPMYGDNYYRIKENAANGTFTYSQTLKVVFENSNNISLYPNPAKNTVTIKGLDKNATTEIKITDMNGREISKKSFSYINSTTLSIRALAQGSYFILVEQNGKVTKLRLVKQ